MRFFGISGMNGNEVKCIKNFDKKYEANRNSLGNSGADCV
jgi:hypothetical protein